MAQIWHNTKRNSLTIKVKLFNLMPSAGIEPVTPSLRVKCSTD